MDTIAPAVYAGEGLGTYVPDLRGGNVDSITISDVVILGHKKTRSRVIFRELEVKRGSTYAVEDLPAAVERSYHTLMNTGLFVEAALWLRDTLLPPGRRELVVSVRETWYIYPVPEFSLADRNFNVWWTEQGRSLDRVNVGAKLNYYNFTGRRDRLRLGFTTGYTREVDFDYRLPYLNRPGTIGAQIGFSHRRRREQNYATIGNRQAFYLNEDDFVYQRTRFRVGVDYRGGLYVRHSVRLLYQDERIADTIARVLNPDFFQNGGARQRGFTLSYSFLNDRRDVRNYPWAGSLTVFSLSKAGLGITGERDGLTAGFTYQKFWPLNPRWSVNAGLAGKYSLIRKRQPFLENRAIGFGNNNLVGYQFYVVDGLDMAVWRAGIRRQLFDTEIDLGKLVFIEAFRYVPLRMLVSVQINQGITNSPFAGEDNVLTNQLLTGLSAGVDVVLYYDMVGSLQYNRNHLGEDGIFLALNLAF